MPCLRTILCTLLFVLSADAQQIVINEVMASNTATIKDPQYGGYADWIELYNAGTASVNIKGWYITDDLSAPRKFVIASDLVIPAKGFALIWADDQASGAHANFKLSGSGEAVGLFTPDGQTADTVTFGAQQSDISYGRYPDGAGTWSLRTPATPGAANRPGQVLEKLAPPVLSRPSGFFPSTVSIAVTHSDSSVTIRCTTDGHTPGPTSPLYRKPVIASSTLVLRVRAFRDGYAPSDPVSGIYFINEKTDLPVFSIITDPENFFSDTSGIYVEGTNGITGHCSTAKRNWNQEWERPVDLEFFERGTLEPAFSVKAGVQIYGGCTRLYPQKSLAFYFRGEYGMDRLKYQLFPDMPIKKFDTFILRSSGQDWWRTMFRDGMAQTLVEQGMKLDDQNYRPSILFINGEYWGIHNIGEKLNEHYIDGHYGIPEDSLDLLQIGNPPVANVGDNTAYVSMMNYVNANSLAAQDKYDVVKAQIDIDEYIDYFIAQIYAANADWPGSNMKLWRKRSPSGRWRWMMYDLDFTFGGNAKGLYNTNTLEWATNTVSTSGANPPWSTLLLRRLLENAEFKNEFIQRYAVHLNTTFEKNHVLAVIDSLASAIAAEIPRHKARWSQSLSLGPSWEANVQIMRDFAALRPDTSRTFFMQKFGIAGTNTLTLLRSDARYGKVLMNGVEASKDGFAHILFRGIPLRLKAVPAAGCRFLRWEGAFTSAAAETTIMINANAALQAVFESQNVSGVARPASNAPRAFRLYDNFPNPFNPSTTIGFSVPTSDRITITIYDMLGREVETLADGLFEAGEHSVIWNTQGRPSGAYLCRLIGSHGTDVRRMTLMK
ncbi:MAG: CotH kinase family protein [Acidobacteriota bacterium]